MAGRKRGKRYFGNVRKLPSGRFQARYQGPDGKTYTARKPEGGPLTFESEGAAEAWLSLRQSEILRGAWLPPARPDEAAATPPTLREYGDAWLTDRDLEQTTRDHYRQLIDDHIYPAKDKANKWTSPGSTFGDHPVPAITAVAVRGWYAHLARAEEKVVDGKKIKLPDRPTTRAHAYALLRTIMKSAVDEDLRDTNPCRVRGGGQSKRVKKIRPASLAELELLVTAMPSRYKLMILLAAWCALRFGELAEMRRSDVDAKNGVVTVKRGVTRTKGRRIVKDPKSEAGKREVNIPPHLLPAVKDHLRDHVAIGKQALLFPSSGDSTHHMAPSTLYKVYYPAREAAGRPDLRFHDLRHTGATLAAATGASLAELMARLGHSTAGAALRYQHAAKERDKVIAEALSTLANGTVTPIQRATKRKASSAAATSDK